MFLKPLMWIFAGLFVLFGLAAMIPEDPGRIRLGVGLSTLSLGGFAISMVGDALATGQIRLQFSVIHRASRPWLFWSAVMLVTAAGAGVLAAGIWFLFFKDEPGLSGTG